MFTLAMRIVYTLLRQRVVPLEPGRCRLSRGGPGPPARSPPSPGSSPCCGSRGRRFRCCDLGRRHGGDLRRVEAVERLADPVPLGLNDLPDPGLEDRARQMLEEERGIVRC